MLQIDQAGAPLDGRSTLSEIRARILAFKDLLAALDARGERLTAHYNAPSERGGYVGDVFFGDEHDTTRGTHRWDGENWLPLPAPPTEAQSDTDAVRSPLGETLHPTPQGGSGSSGGPTQEPVAWGIRYPNGFISPYTHKADAETNCPRTCRVLPLYTSPPTTDREKRLVEAARVAKEELELFVEFAVRQCEFEGDGQAGRDAVNSLTRALEAYYG